MEARTVLGGSLNKLVATPVGWTASLACRTHVLCKNVPEVLDGASGKCFSARHEVVGRFSVRPWFATVLCRFVLGGVVCMVWCGVVWCGVVAR